MLFILLVLSSHHQLDSFRYCVHVLFRLAILLMFLLCQIVATFLRLCGLTWPRYSQIGCYGVSATLFICTTHTHTQPQTYKSFASPRGLWQHTKINHLDDMCLFMCVRLCAYFIISTFCTFAHLEHHFRVSHRLLTEIIYGNYSP